jgi:hypothetical protein
VGGQDLPSSRSELEEEKNQLNRLASMGNNWMEEGNF